MRNDSIDNFRIELNKPSLRGSFYVRQGDTRARTIHITITDNGKIVDLSDAKICELLIKKPDNNQNDQTMVRVGNELQYTLRTQDINVAGECLCQVMVTFKDGTFLTTPTFSVMVYQKEVDQNLEKSTNEYTALSAIILDVEGTQAEINTYVDEKTNEITEIATTATTAATNASASATAASNSADDAEDQADAAARSASDCATYASNCAGLAANCASYLDDVTGIAATKINKVNGEAEGILNIKNGDVTFTDIVGNASNVVSTRASINDCNTKASNAVTTSNNALSKANQAYTFAYSANNNASTAKDISNRTKNKVNIVSGFVGSDIGYSNLPYTVQAGKILDQNGAVVNGSGRVLEMVVGSENVYIERVDLRIVPDGTDARSIAFYKADGTLIGEAEYYETFIDYDEYFSPISEYVKETTLPVPTNAKYLKIAASTSGQAKIFTQDNMSDAVKELQNRPSSITTTSTSPLPNCSASSIVGIDVAGCSTQAISPNIFDFLGASWTDDSGVSHSVSGNTITVVNSLSGNNRIGTNISGIDSSKTYTLSFDSNIASSGGSNIGWVGCNKVKSYSVGHNSFQFSGITTAYFSIYAPSNSTLKISNIMLEEGSTEHSYMPYTGTPTPTNPIAIVDASGEVFAHTVNLVNQPTVGKNWNDGSSASTGYYEVSVESGKTYTVSYNNNDGITMLKLFTFTADSVASYTSLYDLKGNLVTHYTFTVPSGSTRARVLVGCSGTMTEELMASKQVQLEQGTTATSYVAYASNKITLPTLRSIPNTTVKDNLIVNADGGSKTVKVLKLILNGSENWVKSGNNYYVQMNDIERQTNYVGYMLSSHFAIANNNNAMTNYTLSAYMKGSDYVGQNWLYLRNDDCADVTALKAWLSANNVTVYYATKSPTTTTLTASEVSAIRQLQTYSGTTIVDSALDVQSVTYHADTKQYIDGRTDYSYSDTVIGKWADGKDLHRMVISATTPSSANTDTDLLTISNANIKRIDGIVTTSSGNEVPINYFYNTTYYIATWVKNGALRMRVGTLYNSAPCEIIVEYTLTDEATQSDDGIAVLSEGGDE